MTKREAIAKAKKLRAQGRTVKVYRVETLYTQPGRGLAVAITYLVK
jgi:hypothetical protein